MNLKLFTIGFVISFILITLLDASMRDLAYALSSRIITINLVSAFIGNVLGQFIVSLAFRSKD